MSSVSYRQILPIPIAVGMGNRFKDKRAEMNRLNWVTCLLTLALPVSAGDVQGHAVITKRLTKKALSPIVYNLRGAVPGPSAPSQAARESEFDRLVVVLEGGTSRPKPPETVVINQRNMRFEPD